MRAWLVLVVVCVGATVWSSPSAVAQSRWHLTYERACTEVARPVPTPDGQRVLSCAQSFDARTGAFRGRATTGALVVLDDGSVLAQDYTDRGLALHRPGAAERSAHDRGGMVRRIALSPSGRFVATVEDSCPGTYVLVRESASLRRVSQHPLTVSEPDRVSLWVDDHGRARWESPTAAVLHRAATRDGNVRALVRRDGAVVVSRNDTPDVHVARADVAAGVEIAIDDAGSRLAIRDRAGLRVLDLRAGRPSVLFDGPVRGSPMVFARDGARLFLGGTSLVAVTPSSARAWTRPRYAPQLPDDWEAGVVRDGVLTFPSHPGSEWAADSGQIAAFAEREGGAMVTAVATEAAELSGARPLSAWAFAVVSRYEPYSPLETSTERSRQPFRAYRDAEGRRSVDLTIPADGCDPSFRWVRFVEMGDALLRVVVRIPLSMDIEDQNVVRRVFLDAPFGAPVSGAASRVWIPERVSTRVGARAGRGGR